MKQKRSNIKALLQWQLEMGADEAIASVPGSLLAEEVEVETKKADGLAEKEPASFVAPPLTPSKAPGAARTHVPSRGVAVPPAEAKANAQALADAAHDLETLRQAVEQFEGLAIQKTATHTVFCDGNPKAPLMIIGEAPGANEDATGIPFCGDSGQLMDKLFEWGGFSRATNLYISNTLFWRPPGNRKPTPEEVEICRPFVEKHIALVQPKALLLVGATAASGLLGTTQGITRIRGQWHEYSNPFMHETIPAMPLLHPSYLLRQPGQKRYFWQDVLQLKHWCIAQKISA